MIPEDQTHNGYILRPLVKEIMADAGRPLAKIETPGSPRIRGYAMSVIRDELPIPLFCSAAQPEVEIYACAAFRKEIGGAWEDARTNPRMKEEIFVPLLDRHGDPRRPDKGRKRMIAASVKNLPLLYRLCPELKDLRDRIVALLRSG